MLKKILLDQERILAHERLAYMAGPIRVPVEVIITNHRILLLPHNNWSQSLGFHRRNVVLSDIKEMQLGTLNTHLSIQTLRYNFSLWGTGAKRLHHLIQHILQQNMHLESSWASLEQSQVVFCGEIGVNVGAGLTVTGDLFIRRKGFELHYSTLEQHTKSVEWTELQNIEYTGLSQNLYLSTANETLTLQGNAAQLLKHIIDIFNKDDIFVDCIWESQWETSGRKGKGYMMLGQKALYMMPCGKQASIVNAEIQWIPCAKIQQFEQTQQGMTILSSQGQEWNVNIRLPDLWMGYTQRLILHFWASRDHQPEYKVDIHCSKIHSKKDAITFGLLQLIESDISFTPNGNLPPLVIPAYEIVKMNRRSSRLTLQHEVTPEMFEFLEDLNVESVADILEPALSPMSVSFLGKDQDTSSVLGSTKRINIYLDGSQLISINHATISFENKSLYLKCSRFEDKVFIPHDVPVEVDILSTKGHFIVHGVVLEHHLNSPDAEGKYWIHIQQLGSVRLLNQRKDFRVPAHEKILFSIRNCEVDFEDTEGQLVDLSAGGCQIEYRKELDEVDILKIEQAKTTFIIKLNMDVIQQKREGRFSAFNQKQKTHEWIEFGAKLRRLSTPENFKKTIFGLEFLESPPSLEHRLLRKILKLERELLQKHRESIAKS